MNLSSASTSALLQVRAVFVNDETTRFGGKALVIVLGEKQVPVVSSDSGLVDAKPFAGIAAFRQRRFSSVSSVR